MSFKEIVDAVSALGTLGFALLAVYAFLTEKVVPKSRLDEKEAAKKEAMELARSAIANNDRLADAMEAANRLETARLEVERERRRAR